MKTLKYILCGATALWMALSATSCQKDEGDTGTATITRISSVLDRETGIENAQMTQFVIVQGSGLNSVTDILVNDIAVDMDQAYITSKEITFSIPRVVPGTINNLVTLIIPAGNLTAPLNIEVPALKVDGMLCEWAAPGETMYIMGDFFDLYEVNLEKGKLLFGNRELPLTEATPKRLGFVLPADAAPGTIIKIQGGIGEQKTVPGQYRFMGFKVQNYDNQYNVGWGQNNRTSGNVNGAPAPIDGIFARITPSAAQVGWIGEVSFCQSGTEDCVDNKFPDDMVANPSKYQFKFEVNTQKPMIGRGVDFMCSQNGYCWAPGRAVTFHTNGKWQTITLELTTVWNNGAPKDGIIQVMAQYNGEDSDISIDNMRIVPKIH